MRKCVRGVSPCCNEKNVHFYQFIFRDKKITHTKKNKNQTNSEAVPPAAAAASSGFSSHDNFTVLCEFICSSNKKLFACHKSVDLCRFEASEKTFDTSNQHFCMFPWRFFCFPPKQTLLQFSQVFTVSASV